MVNNQVSIKSTCSFGNLSIMLIDEMIDLESFNYLSKLFKSLLTH